jgi:hypothetical protein
MKKCSKVQRPGHGTNEDKRAAAAVLAIGNPPWHGQTGLPQLAENTSLALRHGNPTKSVYPVGQPQTPRHTVLALQVGDEPPPPAAEHDADDVPVSMAAYDFAREV